MLVSKIRSKYLRPSMETEVRTYIKEGELFWPVIKDEDIPGEFRVGVFIEPLGGKYGD